MQIFFVYFHHILHVQNCILNDFVDFFVFLNENDVSYIKKIL